MLLDLTESPLKKKTVIRLPPATPATDWLPPKEFPNLSNAKIIGFDVERKEDDFGHGPGWRRGKARTIGFSIAARDVSGNRGKWYFPIGHVVEPQFNLDREQCLSWLRSILQTPIPKAGANLLYDIGSLTDDNIYVQGPLFDCQFAEALIDSDGLVALDYLGLKYLGKGKETNELYRWCAEAYGGAANEKQRDNIWRASPRLAGPYGEDDADMPIDILERQWPLLHAAGLESLFDLECGLIRLLVKMRMQGVSVDIPAAERLYDKLGKDIKQAYATLFFETGVAIDSVQSGAQLARIFDKFSIQYPLTAEGNPSFRKDYLKNLDHPIATKINDLREMEKIRGTFIRNYILEGNIKGKLFCQFHPLRNDSEQGTKVGRFSSTDPNLQNIPARSELGKLIRKLFIMDRGHLFWEKDDYSQLQYRGLAHFAVGPGSDELRRAYQQDKKTDYHIKTQSNVKELTGMDIERRPIKNMNFGLAFGASEKKIIAMNNFTRDQGSSVFKAYHIGNPYVRPTMKSAETEVQQFGYVTSVLGRRTYFNLWEPVHRDFNAGRSPGLPLEMAIRQYGSQIKRADGHKAIAYRLQGTEADQMKTGMYQCDKAGIFDIIGVPRIQCHDELGYSVADDTPQTREAFAEMRHILETALPQMRVPIFVDHKRGPTWGDCE